MGESPDHVVDMGPVSWFTVHAKCVAMSVSPSRSGGSLSALSSGGSGGSLQSVGSGDAEPPGVPDGDANNNRAARVPGGSRDRADAWWSVGEYLADKKLTHQSARLTLTRVFTNQRDEMWDLTDSLAELYETIQRAEGGVSQLKRNNRTVDTADWLSRDIAHGFIRIYAPDMVNFLNSRLVPVTLSTTVQQVAHSVGLSMNAIHVQLSGDIIRRMDAYEHPLVIQNQYLAGLGYDDINRIQEEGAKEELGYLIRFYSGKPMMDSTFSRNQLQSFLSIKKGGVLQNWIQRLCVLSGTRLLIYKDKYKRTEPQVIQLARGAVEESKFKGHDFCLRLTSTLSGEKVIYLTFSTETEYNKWYRKCKKATSKLPTAADLSNCHLEFLPENIFVNDQLAMLNLRHNVLKERPIEEDIYIIGWLDDLSRFTRLRSLNLADNSLHMFPLAVCHIRTLVELNIASNCLEEIPAEIAELSNLQALHIHNNHLTSLPDQMVHLRKLFILVLAFNRFVTVPPIVAQMTNIRVSEIENIIMAGNRIEHIPSETLVEMKYVKKVDLRMNQLTLSNSETMKFTALEHLTHLDIRDNQVQDLDIRALRTLEYLNCERNDMVILRVNGTQLKNLFASQNCLESLLINPKPEYLNQFNVSYNQLRQLPDWMSDCFFLQKVNVSYNLLSELPARLFIDAKKLKSLRADHNQIRHLPAEVDVNTVEEMYVHHNILTTLPKDFFVNANKLRVFNASKNRLTTLPPVNSNPDLNKLQELYLTANALTDSAMSVIAGFPRLKVLHLAHNELHNLQEGDVSRLEMLQELNISGNELSSLPASIGGLTRLVVLRAHTNILGSLPDFHRAKSLRVLDVGHNQLYNVSVTNLMASQLNLLDMSLNSQLKVDPREFKSIKNRKSICLLDTTGQNRDLPGLKRQSRQSYATEEETSPDAPWKVGFSETAGIRNKLCVGTLKMHRYQDENQSLFGMFDGGHNNEIPKILVEKLPDIVKTEMEHEKTGAKYLKYAMLTAHRSLRAAGQKLGASAAIVHIQRVSSAAHSMNTFYLTLANVGDVEVVLCRHGDAMVLTRKFVTEEDLTECERVQTSDGIITEDNKVAGVTQNTRMLGCAFLYPQLVPCAYSAEVSLRNDDEFIIIANKGLWRYVTYGAAVEEVYHIGNPVVAAKRLMDLAQGCGSKENLSVLVIRLNTDRGPSLGRLKPPQRDLSVDDVAAAARHENALRTQRLARAVARREESLLTGGSTRDHRRDSRPEILQKRFVSDTLLTQVTAEGGSTDTLVNDTDYRDQKHPANDGTTQQNGYHGQQSNGHQHNGRVDENDNPREYTDPDPATPVIRRSASGRSTVVEISESRASTIYSHASAATMGDSHHSVGTHGSNHSSVGTPRASSVDTSHNSVHNNSAASSRASFDYHPGNQRASVDGRSVSRQSSNGSRTSHESTNHHPSLSRQSSVASSQSVSSVHLPVASDVDEPREGSPSNTINKDLRPLPNQRFVKRSAASEWETLLQKRLSSEVKDKELKQMVSMETVSSSNSLGHQSGQRAAVTMETGSAGSVRIPETGSVRIKDAVLVDGNNSVRLKDLEKLRPPAPAPSQPWYASQTAANPAYALNPGVSEHDVLAMTTAKMAAEDKQQTPQKPKANVRSRIAMFENIRRDSPDSERKMTNADRRRTFFSPARPEPDRSHVPPRRCMSPPPNLVLVPRETSTPVEQTHRRPVTTRVTSPSPGPTNRTPLSAPVPNKPPTPNGVQKNVIFSSSPQNPSRQTLSTSSSSPRQRASSASRQPSQSQRQPMTVSSTKPPSPITGSHKKPQARPKSAGPLLRRQLPSSPQEPASGLVRTSSGNKAPPPATPGMRSVIAPSPAREPPRSLPQNPASQSPRSPATPNQSANSPANLNQSSHNSSQSARSPATPSQSARSPATPNQSARSPATPNQSARSSSMPSQSARSPTPNPATSAHKVGAFHGSVENDLYAKVKRVKKEAPAPPSGANRNHRELEGVTEEGSKIVEISHL